jgi:predicted transcriptional regulator
MPLGKETIVALTADIVAAHVSKNAIAVNDMPMIIASVYAALTRLGQPDIAKLVEHTPVISVRASINPDFLVSMINGKRYKILKRHLSQNGYTPQSYREAFNLPPNYPMIAPNCAAKRSELARKIGLGQKPRTPQASNVSEAPRSRLSKRRAKKSDPADA